MDLPPNGGGKEQRLLKNARREGLLLMLSWAVALIWSITVGTLFGYNRDAGDIGLILGFPDWVFWSVVAPWGICLVYSTWFCFWYMADDDLGEDRAGGPGHV
jgi:hypothetical protein